MGLHTHTHTHTNTHTHTHTHTHIPTFASKCDGHMPDFILGEWCQMVIYECTYSQPDAANILMKINKKICWKILNSNLKVVKL